MSPQVLFGQDPDEEETLTVGRLEQILASIPHKDLEVIVSLSPEHLQGPVKDIVAHESHGTLFLIAEEELDDDDDDDDDYIEGEYVEVPPEMPKETPPKHDAPVEIFDQNAAQEA
jgi:hypothetical protein